MQSLPLLLLASAALAGQAPEAIPFAPVVIHAGEQCQIIQRNLVQHGKTNELDTTVLQYPCRALVSSGLIARSRDSWALTETAKAMKPTELAAAAKRAAEGQVSK